MTMDSNPPKVSVDDGNNIQQEKMQPSAGPTEVSTDSAPNLIGYDQQIKVLQELAKANALESDEERQRRERREQSKKTWAKVSDGILTLSNLYFTSQYAPDMYDHDKSSHQKAVNDKLERFRKEREANADKYLQYSLNIGNLENARAKTVREMEEQSERRKLAREKAQRDQEQHGWLAALQPDKQREQTGRANKAEQDAITAQVNADNAPAMASQKLENERLRGGQIKASTAASYASAQTSKARTQQIQQESGRFNAWDKDGNKFTFKTKAEADAFAKQHGTWEEKDVVEETNTFRYDKNGNEKKVGASKKTRKVGYAKKIEPTQPKPKEEAKNQQPAQQAKPQSKGGGSKYQHVKI